MPACLGLAGWPIDPSVRLRWPGEQVLDLGYCPHLSNQSLRAVGSRLPGLTHLVVDKWAIDDHGKWLGKQASQLAQPPCSMEGPSCLPSTPPSSHRWLACRVLGVPRACLQACPCWGP